MPTVFPQSATRPSSFPRFAIGALLFLCVAPVAALFAISAYLDRGCTVAKRIDGDAGPSMVWRIETQQCGGGPIVTNVLVAPRGKTLALAATSTGAPRPSGVTREPTGSAFLHFEAVGDQPPLSIMLPLKATGRPAQSLVIAEGRLRR